MHGIVLVGAMVAMGRAQTPLEIGIAFVGVVLAAGNAVGGYVVTEEFKSSKAAPKARNSMPIGAQGLIQASYSSSPRGCSSSA